MRPLDLGLLEKDMKLKILKLLVGHLIDLNTMLESSKIYINGSSLSLRSLVLYSEMKSLRMNLVACH